MPTMFVLLTLPDGQRQPLTAAEYAAMNLDDLRETKVEFISREAYSRLVRERGKRTS